MSLKVSTEAPCGICRAVKTKNAYIYVCITAILWAGMEVATKFISGQLNSVQITFSRILIGGLILLPLAFRELKRRGLSADLAFFKTLLPLSLLGQAVSLTINQLAIAYAPAAAVSSISACNPIFIVVFSFIILHEPIDRRTIASLLIALCGIILIIAPWDFTLSLKGITYLLLAPLTFSLSSVLIKKPCSTYGGVTVTCFCFIMGAFELMILSLFTHIPQVANYFSSVGLDHFVRIPFFTGYTVDKLPYILYVFVGATGIGFCSYYIAIEKSSALHASIAFFLKPLLSPIYAYILLGEHTPARALIGGGLMLLALSIYILPGLKVVQS